VRHPKGDWSALDPALLTYEVRELAVLGRNKPPLCGEVQPALTLGLLTLAVSVARP
jgi:hypothetical protein